MPNSHATAPADRNVTHSERWRSRTARVLVGLSVVQLALIFLQGALAGSFLTGNAAMLSWHRDVGTEVITWVALAQLVTALLLWRPGRGRGVAAIVAAVTFALVPLQLTFGFEGRLALHIPNALLIFGAQFTLLALACPPARVPPRQHHPARR